jgi:hypothetical protein
MATSALCGSGGVVTGVGSVSEVTRWTIDQTIEALDATSMASNGWKERIACLKGATGSFTCVGVAPAVGPDASVTFKTASVGGYTISGGIIISKVTVNTPVDGVVSFDAEFVFTGTITVS